MREVTMDLMCDLDEHELRDRALQMSSTVIRIDELEQEKKDSNKDFAERLGAQRSEQRRLSAVIRTKRERRAVVCFVEFHSPVNGTKRVTRSDTGEFVRDEPMSPMEMQEHLFEPEQPSAAVAEPAPQQESLGVESTTGVPVEAPRELPNGFDE